jgi:hypothetical protein
MRERSAALALGLAFFRDRMVRVSSPPKPVSEFAPTRRWRHEDARKMAKPYCPARMMADMMISSCCEWQRRPALSRATLLQT